MTPLKAARWIAEADAPEYEGICLLCQRIRQGPLRNGHTPDCPWPALPSIVRALEAAERFVEAHADYPPAAYDEYTVLAAALKGNPS
jgi:hypothetical protein